MKRPVTLIIKRGLTMQKNSFSRIFVRTIAVSILASIAVFIGIKSDTVSGQSQSILKNPTELKSLKNAARGGDQNFNIEIKYALSKIFNPSSGKFDTVNLRNYNGELVGPSMRVQPGQLLRINLINNLPANDPTCKSNEDMDIPHCFNSTNLHTHGWHVSPTGNSDNVLLDIPPATALDYEYYLPKDHPAGTFWYHSHRHGSTALQVSSGMVGTLIVEGSRPLKDKAENGIADIDTILKDASGQKLEDRVFMFEQIQYACTDKDKNSNNFGQIITNSAGQWICPDGQVGDIEQYGNQFGPGTWAASGRFTMINGLLQPLVETQAGKIERWRLIHGGVRDTINFRIVKSGFKAGNKEEMNKILNDVRSKPPAEQKRLIANYCAVGAGKDYNQSEFAVDGLTRYQISNKVMNVLQPGYRSDILVAFNQPGIYCVLDDGTPPEASINSLAVKSGLLESSVVSANVNDTALLSMVFVDGGKPFTDAPQKYIVDQLAAANKDLPEKVLSDLKKFEIPEYAPHRAVSPKEVSGKQELSFAIRAASDTINTTQATTLFQIANKANPTQEDYYSYDPNRIDRILRLGGVDEWTLTSGSIGHPFHIHVNPFQIIQIYKPPPPGSGKDRGEPVVDKDGKCTDYSIDPNTKERILDPQYCDQIGVWRDTLFIKNPALDFTGLTRGYTVIMRTRYERYIGDFVLHCHILDHEDQGMMQNIRIAPIGGYLEGNPVPTEGVMKHAHK